MSLHKSWQITFDVKDGSFLEPWNHKICGNIRHIISMKHQLVIVYSQNWFCSIDMLTTGQQDSIVCNKLGSKSHLRGLKQIYEQSG